MLTLDEAAKQIPHPQWELTVDEILSVAVSATPICGVYFLIRDNKITYVGQSRHCLRRMADHYGQKEFDSYAVVLCPPERLTGLEAHYIDMLDPVDNILGRRWRRDVPNA